MVLKAIGYFLLLIVGFVLLVKGADFFVDGAAGIAKKLKVSTFIIGLTVVALGTSAPEAAVSIIGAIKGEGEVIMGNVLGSNMLNILLILGLSAMITAIPVQKSSRYIEIPFLIAISLLFLVLGDIGDAFEWYDGLILIALYAAFMIYTIIMAKRNRPALMEEASAVSVAVGAQEQPTAEGFKGFLNKVKDKYEYLQTKVWFLIIITLVGLAMVVGGAQFVVDSATFIAEDLIGIPTSVVALTVVAFGTSLPELVTSVSAARKGDMGIATGNIIGSNIANVLLVAGLGFVSSGANPVPFDTGSLMDGYMSIIAAAVLLGFSFFKKNNLTKVAGSVMLALLVAYYTYRIVAACGGAPMLEIPTLF